MLSLKNLKSSETTSWGSDLWMVSKGFKPCHIVDGQQRLTSSLIIEAVFITGTPSSTFYLNMSTSSRRRITWIRLVGRCSLRPKRIRFRLNIFFRRPRQNSIGVTSSDSLVVRRLNSFPAPLETFSLFHRASTRHCKMIVSKIRRRLRTADEEATRMDRIPKLRLPRKLTGRQTVFISGARNFWSSWKIDGRLLSRLPVTS